MAYFLGMDIGGTKTAVALYDREFRPVGKQTMPTRPESGCRELVGRIAEAVQALLDGQHAGVSDVLAAGVACPGPLDLKQGRIVYIPTMGFADEPLTAMLEEALGLPVALENDTNAAALCESVFGQGRGGELVAYITISTGVGCGLVHGRRIVDGGAGPFQGDTGWAALFLRRARMSGGLCLRDGGGPHRIGAVWPVDGRQGGLCLGKAGGSAGVCGRAGGGRAPGLCGRGGIPAVRSRHRGPGRECDQGFRCVQRRFAGICRGLHTTDTRPESPVGGIGVRWGSGGSWRRMVCGGYTRLDQVRIA